MLANPSKNMQSIRIRNTQWLITAHNKKLCVSLFIHFYLYSKSRRIVNTLSKSTPKYIFNWKSHRFLLRFGFLLLQHIFNHLILMANSFLTTFKAKNSYFSFSFVNRLKLRFKLDWICLHVSTLGRIVEMSTLSSIWHSTLFAFRIGVFEYDHNLMPFNWHFTIYQSLVVFVHFCVA